MSYSRLTAQIHKYAYIYKQLQRKLRAGVSSSGSESLTGHGTDQ